MASPSHQPTDRSSSPGHVRGSRISRRAALGLGGAAVVASTIGVGAPAGARPPAGRRTTGPRPAVASVAALQPEIRPRSDWGADLPVTGEILPEDDVRFLLVHHTASTNDYGPDQVVGQIRGFYEFHTGPEKGWPDVAYNFFVDRFGTIWEARAGSMAGPVRGDATGGSQGHALLCSLIGDHGRAPVSDEALDSLTRLLAWLAERHGIDTRPGATVGFISRGSNLWPEGAPVTARTISGHREMSMTSCPGDFAFTLLDGTIPRRVVELRAAAQPTTTTTAAPTTTTTAPATSSSTVEEEVAAAAPVDGGPRSGPVAIVGGAVAAGVAVLAGAMVRLRRRAGTARASSPRR